MRIIRNDPYIKKRAKIGEIAMLAGLGALAIALVLTFTNVTWYAPLMVLVGFMFSNVGIYYGDRFVGEKAPYAIVEQSLKGLDDQYTLISYHLPAPFVLIDPGGVTVITVKHQAGEISYVDKKWQHRERGAFFSRLAGKEGLGQPERDLADDIARVNKLLAKNLPSGTIVPVRGVLLFTNAEAKLRLENPPVPGFAGRKIQNWLWGPGRRTALSKETQAVLLEALGVEPAQ